MWPQISLDFCSLLGHGENTDHMSLPFGLDSLAQQASKLKLQGGLAGKICQVLIFVALAMAIIAWSVHEVWIAAAALGLIFILVFSMLWRLITLAEKNPHSALMEGAELLVHQQLMVASKGGIQIPTTLATLTAPAPLQLSPAELKTLAVPEPNPKTQTLEEGQK